MTTIKWKIAAALAAVVALVAPMGASASPGITPSNPGITQQTHQGVWISVGDSSEQVRQVQMVLRSFGYGIAVDGVFGEQTLAAVLHWQRSNGLLPDGIVGPVTWATLMPADNPPEKQLEPSPPVAQPAVVTQVSGNQRCPQYEDLLVSNGMPVGYFTYVMWRETGGTCDPHVHNGRGQDDSFGLLQINTKGALWGEVQRRCGLSSKDQLFNPSTNIRCGAALYRAYGKNPWSTS